MKNYRFTMKAMGQVGCRRQGGMSIARHWTRSPATVAFPQSTDGLDRRNSDIALRGCYQCQD